MIETLGKMDKRTAAGVLARAALELSDQGNPAARAVLEGEDAIRTALLNEIRRQLRIGEDDNTPKTINALSEFLDQESERLLGPLDEKAALKRLAERGDLPSDLYEFDVDPGFKKFYGARLQLEMQLIEATIHSPLREQHYGRSIEARAPSLVSLFFRPFTTPYPFKNFGMLVAGSRDGLLLHVCQAWRIYSSSVDTRGTKDLVDLLRRFSDVYGSEIEIAGKRDHFFEFAEQPVAINSFKIEVRPGQIRTFVVSQFAQPGPTPGSQRAALVVAIDLEQYHATLKKMDIRGDQIEELSRRKRKSRAVS